MSEENELKLCPIRAAAFLAHYGQSPQIHHERSRNSTVCDPKCQYYVDSAETQHCHPILLMARCADALGRLAHYIEKSKTKF